MNFSFTINCMTTASNRYLKAALALSASKGIRCYKNKQTSKSKVNKNIYNGFFNTEQLLSCRHMHFEQRRLFQKF